MALGCDEGGGAAAQDRAEPAGERVVLRATHPLGVPLHPGERDRHLSGRLPDGTEVEVVRWGEERRWLEVRAEDGTRGWIVRRYVAPSGGRAEVPGGRSSPWASAEACRAAVAEGVERPAERARIASWNLRWFPDGSSHGPSDQPTDVDWMACAMASLGADVIAVQEVMLHPRGRAAVEQLAARLNALTGGRWESRFDECRRDGRQHVGFLFDASRARAVAVEQLDELNPLGGCAHHLRPGLAAYFRWRGGLDLHAAVVHLDSGREARDHRHRRQSVVALERAMARLRAAHPDDDVVILGDFNTMGCRTCPGPSEAEDEIAWLDARIASLQPALRRLRGPVGCTEYYRRRGSLLDHVLVSAAMREIDADAPLEVAGACARFRCRLPRGRQVAALDRLSDHCAIVAELEVRDAD